MPASPRKNSNSPDSSSSRRSTSPRAVISPDAMQHAAKLSEVNASYVVLMVTSGILAAVAMLTNSIPVLIGSMVIAPALPPLALLSFAIINRRPKLVRKGFVSACCGLTLAVLAALVTTWLLNATHVIPKETNLLNKVLLDERVNVGWYSVVTAIAAGITGMIALTERKTDTLVGVVSALALVPAGVAGAIAFLSEDPIRGWGGIALLGLNAVLIVTSGVITLLVLKPNVEKP
ncbi:MAG: hypothetical protein DCF25_20945 [Leptolyngbya foveolarum]|uniref:DUF389 domain-containing protein n=1 Tax=Leptolyngbya foveolarum TaxID=47253 RepID=A0A2W4TYZ5_9CYAN|nr:MAG: hypothetical protein DCF25_20945 [Leptolyngbya foveolarum]